MSKYVCIECGEIFSQAKRHIETHGFSVGPYEVFYVCPCCGGDYVRARRCDVCGDWIVGQYIKLENGERICDECYTIHEIGEEDY
jgi:formylmethanofuran dehydrogenase subunit E